MSTSVKWIIGIVIVAVAGYFLWSSGMLSGAKPAVAPAAETSATAQATSNTPPPTLNGMSAATDTSDAALAQDTAAIDAQMQGLGTDSTSIDTSMNDQQITQ